MLLDVNVGSSWPVLGAQGEQWWGFRALTSRSLAVLCTSRWWCPFPERAQNSQPRLHSTGTFKSKGLVNEVEKQWSGKLVFFKLLFQTWGQYFCPLWRYSVLARVQWNRLECYWWYVKYFFIIAYLGYACIMEITTLVKYPIQIFLAFQKFALYHITFLLGKTYIVFANQEIWRAFSLLWK